MMTSNIREIAEFLERFHQSGLVVQQDGEPFPVVVRGESKEAGHVASNRVTVEQMERAAKGDPKETVHVASNGLVFFNKETRDDEQTVAKHVDVLRRPGENRVLRAFAARELAAYIARHEPAAHTGERLERSIEQASNARNGLREARAQIDERVADKLRLIYRDPKNAGKLLSALLSVAPDRLVLTRDIVEVPDVLGELRGGLLARGARAEARAAVGDLALLINERGDITRRLVDAGDAVSEAFARTETQEGAVAKAARSQLTALGALLGAVGLPSPLLFLTASSELAVGATAEDVAGAEGVPTEYLSELTDQLERGGVIRRLEESIPPGSAMENEQTGRKARGTGASPPIRKPSVGLRHGAVPPIERFILASEAVKRNDSAAGRLLSAGDVVASHTAGRWSARASAHMLDAAFAIKADHRSLQAAHEQGLLPAIDTLLETARRINRGAPTPREQEVDLSQ